MDLKINYELTKSVGNDVLTKHEEFQALLDTIKSNNNNLKTYWEGSDSEQYAIAVEEQARYMQDLSDEIASIGNFLIKVGNEYERVAQENANSING